MIFEEHNTGHKIDASETHTFVPKDIDVIRFNYVYPNLNCYNFCKRYLSLRNKIVYCCMESIFKERNQIIQHVFIDSNGVAQHAIRPFLFFKEVRANKVVANLYLPNDIYNKFYNRMKKNLEKRIHVYIGEFGFINPYVWIGGYAELYKEAYRTNGRVYEVNL